MEAWSYWRWGSCRRHVALALLIASVVSEFLELV